MNTTNNKDRTTNSVASLVFAALMMPAVVLAASPGVDARELGTTEALLSYCTKAAPATAVRLRNEILQMGKGINKLELTQVRASPQYQQAKDSLLDFVAKVDPHNAVRICSESVRKSQ